jgi:hypothetical protein
MLPPTDMAGVLDALVLPNLPLQGRLTLMLDYPLVVLPTLADLPPPHGLGFTREEQLRVIDWLRASLIAPCWVFWRCLCQSATTGNCGSACRSWPHVSAKTYGWTQAR